MALSEGSPSDPCGSPLRRLDLVLRGLLPRPCLAGPAVDVGWVYRPAEDVGGDLLDVVAADGAVHLFVGDVESHDTAAALEGATLKGILHAQRDRLIERGPAELLGSLNGHVADLFGDTFVTAAACLRDVAAGVLRYALAGHPPVLVADAAGVTRLDHGGLPLGVERGHSYQEGTLTLRHGAVVLLYSDGVIETASGAHGGRFGIPALARALVECRNRAAADIAHAIGERVDGFRGRVPQDDDLTVLAARYLPHAGSEGRAAPVG
jgi:serine phosphatase RsbU (regulator of sigma subunit)